ncbi:MAG: hypothetical protein AAF725_16905 [Acidobacteriota bacterium]
MKTRSRWTLAAFLTLTLAALPGTASAQSPSDCLVGPSTAATLLFPYFEVDLSNVDGITTLLSINSGVSGSSLSRVVVWTDRGIPVLAFDIFLSAFDVQTINLRSVLEGNIPSTGAGEDLSSFGFCGLFPPNHINPVLEPAEISQLRADLTGVQGPNFVDCAGTAFGDNRARGYVTVDVVQECSGVESGVPAFTPARTSTDFPYFEDGSGNSVAIDANILWGDVVTVDFAGNAAQGSEAVAVYSDPNNRNSPDSFTFYGRFFNWDARDHRVPLPATWNQRYLNGGPFAGGADLTVWRDPGVPVDPFTCGTVAAPFPLGDVSFYFDEEGNFVLPGSSANFPLSTQRVSIDDLSVPFDFGWIQIETSPTGQAWVQPTLQASGRFSAALNGTPIFTLCEADPTP